MRAPAKVCVYAGEDLARYGFGPGHPFGPDRLHAFRQRLQAEGLEARIAKASGDARYDLHQDLHRVLENIRFRGGKVPARLRRLDLAVIDEQRAGLMSMLPRAESRSAAAAMLEELRVWPVLKGVRGTEASDVNALIDAILAVARLVTDFPEIAEIVQFLKA